MKIGKACRAPRTPRGIPLNTPNEFGHNTAKENVVTILVLSAPHTRPIPWPVSFENLVTARNSVPSHLPKEDLNLGRDPRFPNVPLSHHGADLEISLYRELLKNSPEGSKLQDTVSSSLGSVVFECMVASCCQSSTSRGPRARRKLGVHRLSTQRLATLASGSLAMVGFICYLFEQLYSPSQCLAIFPFCLQDRPIVQPVSN